MSPPNLSALQNIQEGWLKMRTRKNKNKNKNKKNWTRGNIMSKKINITKE